MGPGKRGWQSPEGNWKTTLAHFVRMNEYTWDLYVRVSPPPGDNRLIIDTPGLFHSRGLLRGIRAAKGPLSATMHLTPQEKANKALVYRKCERRLAKIEDIGNVVKVMSRVNNNLRVVVDLSKSAEDIDK